MPEFIVKLAPERFARYLAWANGNERLAVELYAANIALSEAFYTPLHLMEICLRNRIDQRLNLDLGSDWLENTSIIKSLYLRERVIASRSKMQRRNPHFQRGDVIAELNFGFWVGMFGKDQSHLWGPYLRKVFPDDEPVQRKHVATKLDSIRFLRNRIAHYEPIIQLPLGSIYSDIDVLVKMLLPEAGLWLAQNNRFSLMWPDQPIILGQSFNSAIDVKKLRF